jgi:transposase
LLHVVIHVNEVASRGNHPFFGGLQESIVLTAAFRSSAGKQQRGPISKQRNAWLQTALIEAAKLAPRWNPQLAALHAHQRERGHANRATLQVARKLVAYLLAVDKNGQPFQVRTPPLRPKAKPRKSKKPAALTSAA